MSAAMAAGRPEELVVAAGGDGTLSTVVNALLTRAPKNVGKRLGVIPFGTLNHFSRDLGLPQEIKEAVLTLATGRERLVDVAEVNGRIFLNNSSLGIYPHMVRRRQRLQETLGYGKWPALAWAALQALRGFPTVSLRLDTEDTALTGRSPFVFIGNHPYRMDLLKIGQRERLDSGRLGVYFVRATDRLGLLRVALHSLLGITDNPEMFENLTATQTCIESVRPWLHVATDGEINRMRPPLLYRTRPKRVRVMVSSQNEPS